MRNLCNTKHRTWPFPDAELTAVGWDFDRVICVFGPSKSSPAITLKVLGENASGHNNAETIASWNVPSPSPGVAVDRVLNLHCVADTRVITLVFEGGDIVIVHPEPQSGQELIEIVGSVDVGIFDAAWSPDEDLLALATKADTLLLMTKDFEGAANIALTAKDIAVTNHVSVGWGKTETQFQGRGAAKALRDPTVPEHIDEGSLSPFDNGRVSISWRGDGQYVAINSVLEGKRRIIRVYSREGKLESVSEPVNGLEGALSWKPSGQIIAGVQRLETRINVLFFERNGLRHGDFDLRLGKDMSEGMGSLISLCWNIDSTVLAVTLRDRIQLWSMDNYHWYLKQDILVSSGTDLTHPPSMSWHPEKPLHLAAIAGSLSKKLSYVFDVCRGPVVPPNDLGLVAVIDGKQLKVTPLRTNNIPPPMALDEIDLPAPAVDAAFNTDGTRIAVLHASEVSLWSCNYAAIPFKSATLRDKHSIMLPSDLTPAASRQAVIIHVGCETITTTRSDCDKIVFDDNIDATRQTTSANVGLSFSSEWLLERWHSPTGPIITFCLIENGILHVERLGRSLLRIAGCTSFLVTQSHLIYTTNQHLLKFAHLHDGDLGVPPDEPAKDERCRNIERGARLVTVMPSAYSLILQMPRGNLETIYPRALVLAGVRLSILKRDYKKALLTCRVHRVDMNILHDYAPRQFMADLELFIKQVKKTEYIDLFLSSLSEENVVETMYKETLCTMAEPPLTIDHVGLSPQQRSSRSQSKVDGICDGFLRVLTDKPQYSQSVITAHICKNPADLEAALELVSNLRKEDKLEELEQVIDHICFLADVNQLYETALGLYDLDVALLVAQQSQKDPREYLPYLQTLHNMPAQRQRFNVDNDLKRFRKALTHLRALDAWEELKAYLVKHELYSAAIELYRYDTLRLTELMQMHADFLSSHSRFQEAGVAYEYVCAYASAYEAYRSANMWRECLAAAALVPMAEDRLSVIASELAASLEEAKDYRAAATVSLDYLHDLEGAVKLLCKGYQFVEATRLVSLHRKPGLLKLVDQGLIEASASTTELLAEMKSQIAAQVPRLRELRQKQINDPLSFLDGANGENGDVLDNISLAPTDASTTGTFMTRYTSRSAGTLATNATHKTSKNRKREERKRARGKKGTIYEEEYLVNSIARLVERLNSVGDDVIGLVQSLMRRTMRERAVAVETARQDIREACTSCMEEVFGAGDGSHDDENEQRMNHDAGDRPVGGQGVLWDALRNTSWRRQAPVLKAFESMTF